MIQNKKGLSDIVTTALIILLVAVAVAAIWAFVSPALRGTGTQFTKTQVCISNIIEPITCKSGISNPLVGPSPNTGTGTNIAKWYKDVQIRRTLTDGVAVPQSILVTVDGKSSTAPNDVTYATNDYFYSSGPSFPTGAKKDTENNLNMQQGALVTVKPANYTAVAGITEPSSQASQTKVTTTYRLPDNTIVVCNSLPITCD